MTKEQLATLRSLGLTGRLTNYPLEILRLAELIAELQTRVATLEGRKRK